MDTVIRSLSLADRPAVARLLDEAVGPGFWGFDGPGEELSFVAVRRDDGAVVGSVLCRLEPAGVPDALVVSGLCENGGAGPAIGAEGMTDAPLLHVRAVAVAPRARRQGVARRLLTGAEDEAAARGATAAYLFAWLPYGQPEPEAVPLYLAEGYVPCPDIPDFYAAGSIASGARCPYCGAPPCRCAARPYLKSFVPG